MRILFIACIASISTILFAADAIHVVKRGETLYSLARGYGISVNLILRKNNISDPALISVGTELYIPEMDQVSDFTHLVQKGDTYYSISRRHNMSIQELLNLNERTASSLLSIGDELFIKTSFESKITTKKDGKSVKKPFWPVSGEKKSLKGKLIGVSIEADALSFVDSVASGLVVWTGPYRGFGQVVLVDSNSYIYLYGGNEDIFVNVGQRIVKGNRIGRLGSSGPGGGKQNMVFSVFKEGVPMDPEKAPRQ